MTREEAIEARFRVELDLYLKAWPPRSPGHAEECAKTLRDQLMTEIVELEASGWRYVPEGSVVVPREPTEAMQEAAERVYTSGYTGTPTATPDAVYRAMIQAGEKP